VRRANDQFSGQDDQFMKVFREKGYLIFSTYVETRLNVKPEDLEDENEEQDQVISFLFYALFAGLQLR